MRQLLGFEALGAEKYGEAAYYGRHSACFGLAVKITSKADGSRSVIPVTRIFLSYDARVRADWHQYFMGIAHQAATRATCMRKHVGAVIVRDRTVLSTGYNGSVRGAPHCEDVGRVIEDGHCI